MNGEVMWWGWKGNFLTKPDLLPLTKGETERGLRPGLFNATATPYRPWHLLYFLLLPQGHFSFRPTLPAWLSFLRASVHVTQVQASGWSVIQFGRTIRILVLR